MDPQCQIAFENLKKLLTSAPVFAFPCFEKSFILETDALGSGLGAVLAKRQDNNTRRGLEQCGPSSTSGLICMATHVRS